MKMTMLLKLTALAGLLAWCAIPARAGKYSDTYVSPSSGAYFVGYDGGSVTPAKNKTDRVFTSSGAFIAQSTSPTSAHKPFRVQNNAGTDVLSTTQGGNTTGTFIGDLTGNATTATALAANGANCSAGQYPLGVDASGAVETCTPTGAGDAVLTSTQIWSGGNTLYGPTTFYGAVFVSPAGGTAMSTITYLASGLNTTQTSFLVCIGTATLLTYGEDLRLTVAYVATNSAISEERKIAFLLDGAFLPGYSSTVGQAKCYQNVSSAGGFGRTCPATIRVNNVAAGTHSVCLAVAVSGNTDTTEHTDAQTTLMIERIR